MKATIPSASNRPVMPPMIAAASAGKCDAFGTAVDVGGVVVVLTCMFCAETLQTKVVSHEKVTYLKLTSIPTVQTLRLVQDSDLRATLIPPMILIRWDLT